MRYSEVMKALEENPKRKFEFKNVDRIYTVGTIESPFSTYFSLKAVNGKGKNISDTMAGGFNGNFKLDADWQEVKQSVTWQEALEAWANGYKEIYCIDNEGEKWTYNYKESKRGELVAIEDGIGLSPNEIKKGTWYIEN